jgi:replicative DNA helicase
MGDVIPIPKRAPELGDGKQPPHDPYAEAASLTACMLTPEHAANVLSIARPTDFFWAGHRAIAECIAEIVERGDAPDMTAVGLRLNQTGKAKMLGGVGFLAEMAEQIPAITNPDRFAARVRDLSRLRDVALRLRSALAEAYEPIDDVNAFLARTDASIGEVTRATGTVRATTSMTATKAVIAALGTERHGHISTGFSKLDRMTTGFEPQALYVLGGRPGMGKTAIAIQYAVTAAKAGYRVLFVSLEMSHGELMARALSSESGVPLQNLRERRLSPTMWSRLTQAASQIGPLPLVIADAPGQSVLDVRGTARKERAQLVIVDHLGLLKAPASKSKTREQEVAEFSRGMKAMAKELNIPVLALAQVNREVAKSGARPSISNLRESGAIEQDADDVWFVHRPGYYKPRATDEEKREGELIVAKQRNGPTGIVQLVWDAEHTRFETAFGHEEDS